MKTLILYATKYGATQKIAESIARQTGGAVLQNVGDGGAVSLSEYGCVVLGSPLTAGMIHKKIKDFAVKNEAELKTKRIGLFVSGLQPEGEAAYLEQNFPPELLKAAAAKAFLGGVFDPQKCGFFARAVIRAAARLNSYTSLIDEEKIRVFSRSLAE